MSVRVSCLLLSSLIGLAVASPGVPAENVFEVWRSPFGRGRSISVNATDGSVWVATGSSIIDTPAR